MRRIIAQMTMGQIVVVLTWLTLALMLLSDWIKAVAL